MPDPNAKPLYADRLVFPDKPGFDPAPYFDESTLDLYKFPLTRCRDPESVGEPPPVQLRAAPGEKVKLLRKLAESGLLVPIPEGAYYDKFRSGLFGVPKDAVRDRMVLDGRPGNMLDRGQTKWCHAMANASALCGLHLQPDEVLVCGGADLKDFFYQFVVEDERCARNVLRGNLTISEAKLVFGPGFTWPCSSVAIGLSSLAMGDTCAVEYAQCAHLSVMLQHGVCDISHLLTLRGSIPRGGFQVGIIVDDLILLEKVLRSSFGFWVGVLQQLR